MPSSQPSNTIDTYSILKAIESQHSIFVERAKEIYSFAHLSFQEFFTARYIVENATRGTLSGLITKYAQEDRWREVILLTTSMLQDATPIFIYFLRTIDAEILKNQTLADILRKISYLCNGNFVNSPFIARLLYYNLLKAIPYQTADALEKYISGTAPITRQPTKIDYKRADISTFRPAPKSRSRGPNEVLTDLIISIYGIGTAYSKSQPRYGEGFISRLQEIEERKNRIYRFDRLLISALDALLRIPTNTLLFLRPLDQNHSAEFVQRFILAMNAYIKLNGKDGPIYTQLQRVREKIELWQHVADNPSSTLRDSHLREIMEQFRKLLWIRGLMEPEDIKKKTYNLQPTLVYEQMVELLGECLLVSFVYRRKAFLDGLFAPAGTWLDKLSDEAAIIL